MHLLTFEEAGTTRIGVLSPKTNTVADLSVLAPGLPQDMLGFILQGELALTRVRDAIDNGEAQLPIAKLKLLAPIPRPLRNILCVGKNYPEHDKEVQSVVASEQENKSTVPESPIIFTKATSGLVSLFRPGLTRRIRLITKES